MNVAASKDYRRLRRVLDPHEELRRAAREVVALPESEIAHRHLADALSRVEHPEQSQRAA